MWVVIGQFTQQLSTGFQNGGLYCIIIYKICWLEFLTNSYISVLIIFSFEQEMANKKEILKKTYEMKIKNIILSFLRLSSFFLMQSA
jgi:hypothetical protein